MSNLGQNRPTAYNHICKKLFHQLAARAHDADRYHPPSFTLTFSPAFPAESDVCWFLNLQVAMDTIDHLPAIVCTQRLGEGLECFEISNQVPEFGRLSSCGFNRCKLNISPSVVEIPRNTVHVGWENPLQCHANLLPW